jgi:hypothetical protein
VAWHGPYTIRRLLEGTIGKDAHWPPPDGLVYVVTRERWISQPSEKSGVLYVGGNTGPGGRFWTRVGDLIADMFGFYGDRKTGHHSGGRRLHEWCRDNAINPMDLYIGWKVGKGCKRCAEIDAYAQLCPGCNKNRPARCKTHGRRAP